jgi:hypothetical protein
MRRDRLSRLANDDGMSDESKKRRTRAWIWWTLFVVFVLYPLSMGASARNHGGGRTRERDHGFLLSVPPAVFARRSSRVRASFRLVRVPMGQALNSRANRLYEQTRAFLGKAGRDTKCWG